MSIALYPANDLALTVKLQQVDPTSGVKTPLTDGAVTAFLATTNSPSAVAADASLSVSATHLTGGKWLVFFDASLLSPTLLDTLFASVTPYLIIQMPDQVRVYVELAYSASRPATVVE